MRALLLIMVVFCKPAWAGPQVATITAIQGEVKIFSHPHADTPQGPPPHAKYEGLFYSVRDAKVGDKVEKGNIIRTQTGGRARVIYDNGDQIYVAAASSYKIEWDKDTNDANPELELRYGKGRFVIQKGGPRGKFRIKTKSAVLGVRGTDFFVAVNEVTGETETATLRGAVEMKAPAATAQPATVPAGQTGSIGATETPALHATTKAELQAVQRNTVLTSPEPTPPPSVQEVKSLEAAAEKATIADIRAVDPAAAQKLEQLPQGQPHLDEINQSTIDRLQKTAPTKGSVGPIADQTLEKPQGSPDDAKEKKAPEEKSKDESKAEEPEPYFPKIWLGLKFGPHGSHFENGNNVSNGIGLNSKDDGGASLAATFELELGRNLSLLGEFYPTNKRNSTFGVYCASGNCPGSGYGDYRVKMNSIDWFVGIRPTIPFGRSRWFAIHLILGGQFNHFTSAELTGPTGITQDLYSEVAHDHFSVAGGGGVTIRPGTRFKISVEIRASHSVDHVSDRFYTLGPTSTQLNSFSDVSGLLGVALGL